MSVWSDAGAQLRRVEAGFWRALTWWAEPRLDLPVAMFRWLLGLALIVSYAQLVVDFDLYFARLGMCPRADWHTFRPERSLSYFQYVTNEATCKAIAFAAFAPMLCFWWGIFPRVSALVSWYALVSLHDRCPLILDGSDFVLRLMLFLFIFTRSDRRLSPIAPVVTPQPSDSFPVRLMQVQLCLIYLTTGLQKMYGSKWTGGTALGYTLQLDSFSRGNWTFFAENPLFVNVSTYGTLVFELSFIYLVWPKATRAYVLAAGVALHAGIEVLMYVPMFSWVMASTYVTFFEPAWAERWTTTVLAPYARWARRRGYAATVGRGCGELHTLLPKLDVFRAVDWSAASEAGAGDMAEESVRVARRERGGGGVSGFGAWARLALCVPSLIVWLPVLAVPGGARWMERAFARAAL